MTESIKSLRLEAIFYPKFDNEKQQQENQGSSSIRSAMLNALDENESRTGDLTAVVEVSLKHSGSLLLWSGADRYYAKNSMDNIFTLTGELLLRQHFARVFQSTHGMSSSDSEGTMSSSSTDGGNKRKFDECVGENEHMYLSCSQEVQKRRLCLAFEMVTAVLGDHGDVPKRDYLILTAVADLKKKQFYSTIDLVEFAQRWRLPHNDVWLFRTRSSTESVFSLYDNLRETGLATTVVEKLNQITQDNLESEHAIYMKSMYPHIHFQGDILEGLVMRLVMQSSSGIQLSQTLSFKSKEILEMIPPEKTSYSKNNLNERTKDYPSACLCTDLRGLFIDAEKNTDKVEKMLRDLLKNERLVTSTQNSTVAFEFNLVREVNSFINRFTNGSSDSESYKIAQLIQNLSLMNAPVDFKSNYVSHGSDKGQIISTIHVKADHVFPSYYKKKKEQDLDLYRGFFIRVNDKCEDDIDQANFFNKFKQETISFKEPMMLKMKFLPYMVRTFIIRNGLGILRKQGEQPFMQYASTQLKKWNMSANAQHKWMPLFRKWTKYAMPLLRLDPPSITSQSYLSHFLNFYSEVEFSHLEVKEGCNKSIFKALVMVVGVSPVVKLLSEHISSVIGAHHIKALKKLTPEKAAYARSVTGNGLVCACEIQEGVGKVRRLLPKYQNCIYVLFVGCSENEISASCASYGSKERKKVKGMLKAWKETKFARTEYVSENSLFNLIPFKSGGNINQSLSSVSDIIEKLWKFSSTLAVKDEEPGVLIFFPSIPGAGKSSISSLSSNDICDIQNVHGGHRVLNLCSDDIKGKFWPQIRQEKLDDTSTILLADKNAPPNAWETIHSICAGSHNMAIPILPDGAGLSTLKVQGDSSHIQCKQLSDSKREPVNHIYPFPLHYLAVCISRVLMREEGSHVGRLDRSTKNACMIVVKFLSFYRNYTVERLLDEVPCHSTIFRVPFFNNTTLPPLPNSLHDALIDALRLQYDLDRFDKGNKQLNGEILLELCNDIDARLKTEIIKNSEFLASICTSESISKASFISQLKSLRLRREDIDEGQTKKRDSIKLVAVDIKFSDVWNTIQQTCATNDLFKSFLHTVFGDDSKRISTMKKDHLAEAITSLEKKIHGQIIKETHITIAHFSTVSSCEMRSLFGSYEGEIVNITVNALLIGSEAAALEVSNIRVMNGTLLKSRNEFVHISIWCKESAKSSNELSNLASNGAAARIELPSPQHLTGRVSFWMK